MESEQQAARRSLLRNAVVFTPLFLLTIAGLVLSFQTGAYVLVVILAIVSFLFGYQGIQSIRDLRAQPTGTSGTVQRRWSRADFVIIGRSYYIMVQREVFRIPALEYHNLAQGDTVHVTHYPHTNTVIELRKESPQQDA